MMMIEDFLHVFLNVSTVLGDKESDRESFFSNLISVLLMNEMSYDVNGMAVKIPSMNMYYLIMLLIVYES